MSDRILYIGIVLTMVGVSIMLAAIVPVVFTTIFELIAQGGTRGWVLLGGVTAGLGLVIAVSTTRPFNCAPMAPPPQLPRIKDD